MVENRNYWQEDETHNQNISHQWGAHPKSISYFISCNVHYQFFSSTCLFVCEQTINFWLSHQFWSIFLAEALGGYNNAVEGVWMIYMFVCHVPYKRVPFHKNEFAEAWFCRCGTQLQMPLNSLHLVPNDFPSNFLAFCKELLSCWPYHMPYTIIVGCVFACLSYPLCNAFVVVLNKGTNGQAVPEMLERVWKLVNTIKFSSQQQELLNQNLEIHYSLEEQIILINKIKFSSKNLLIHSWEESFTSIDSNTLDFESIVILQFPAI